MLVSKVGMVQLVLKVFQLSVRYKQNPAFLTEMNRNVTLQPNSSALVL